MYENLDRKLIERKAAVRAELERIAVRVESSPDQALSALEGRNTIGVIQQIRELVELERRLHEVMKA